MPGSSVPPSGRTSIWPAAAVVIVAVVTLALFGIVDVATSRATTTTTVPAVVVGALTTEHHTRIFASDVSPGVPPANVATALIVPSGTHYVRTLSTGSCACAGDYSIDLGLSVRASRAALLGYYLANFEALGWNEYSKSEAPDGLGLEYLFQKAGDDGNYWEVGVIARPTVRGVTSFEFRLFEVTDS